MNQRLQGWKLALALLIAAIAIGAFGFGAYQLLSDDDQNVATGNEDQAATPTATTQSVESTVVPTSTILPPPTPLTVPSSPPEPVATAVPPTPTATPAPTAAPQPTPSGPTPTATPDPSVVTVTCSGTVPSSVDINQVFGPLTAVTVPADAAAGYQFVWDFGDNTTVTSPSTGNISYGAEGTYAISVTGTNPTTGGAVSAPCGSVTVVKPVATLAVSCSVASVNSEVELPAARAGDTMRVTTSWIPADIGLYLQYEFETTDDLIIVNPATSGDSQTNAFDSNDAVFSIFWRYQDTGDTGRLSCPAYPGSDVDAPTPTATVEAPTPTPTTT